MICPNCGTDNPRGNKYCMKCGSSILEIRREQKPEKRPEIVEEGPVIREQVNQKASRSIAGVVEDLSRFLRTFTQNKPLVKNVRVGALVILGAAVVILVLSQLGLFEESQFDPKIIPAYNGTKWGYVNKNGEWLINPQFDDAQYFSDGLGLVRTDGKYGFVDKDGQLVISATLMKATPFSDGLACVVTERGKPTYINKSGQTAFSADVDYAGTFSNGLAPFAQSGKWGYLDKGGKIKIPAQFDRADRFSEGLAAVRLDSKWGYANNSGKVVINYQFEAVDRFSGGLARVMQNGRWGYVSSNGRMKINTQFSEAGDFSEGLAPVKSGRLWGFINEDGNIVINQTYESALKFSEGLAPVEQGNAWGYINKKGEWEINPQYTLALPFQSGAAIVVVSRQVGTINRKGEYLANPQFQSAKEFFSTQIFDLVETDFFDAASIGREITEQINRIAANAQSNWSRPTSSPYGGYSGGYYSIPSELQSSPQAYYSVRSQYDYLYITGTSKKNGSSSITVQMSLSGQLYNWSKTGKLSDAPLPAASEPAATPSDQNLGGTRSPGLSSQNMQSNRDAIINDLNNLAAQAYQYRIRPSSMGGGQGSYIGFAIPQKMVANENGRYLADPSPQQVILTAISALDPNASIVVTLDSDGRFGNWRYFGAFSN